MVLEHANTVLDWQENLSKDEMPPSWMWPFAHELELWFEDVDQKRKEKHGIAGGDETVPMMNNELAKGRR